MRLKAFVDSSLGRKALMSLTGLALVVFLFLHLGGNLTLFAGDGGATFDRYARSLEENPLILAAELGLLALFLAHIALGLRQALVNREARPARYRLHESQGGSGVAARSMVVTGLIVLVFLVIHVTDFRLAQRRPEGLAAMVVRRLRQPLGAAIYLVGVGALGVHLWHAFQSLFQTLGISHPRFRGLIRRGGVAVSLVLALGFASLPVYTWIGGAKKTLPPLPAAAHGRAPAPDALAREEPLLSAVDRGVDGNR